MFTLPGGTDTRPQTNIRSVLSNTTAIAVGFALLRYGLNLRSNAIIVFACYIVLTLSSIACLKFGEGLLLCSERRDVHAIGIIVSMVGSTLAVTAFFCLVILLTLSLQLFSLAA